MKFDLLMQHAHDLGLCIHWDDLGPRRRGQYRHNTRCIDLSQRMTYSQRLATLAHEIGHAVFGDCCTEPAAERRAWEFASSLIITPDEYADAEAVVGHSAVALATELDVTPKLIHAWRRWYRCTAPKEFAARGTDEWPPTRLP